MIYPCDQCKEVRQPQQCIYKGCKAWQQWFVSSWEQARKLWVEL